MFLKRLNFPVSIRQLSSSNSNFYDIVIVGGGLVGNAMACSIAASPVMRSQKALVLESGRPKTLSTSPSETFGIRVSAVNPSSVNLFKKLGIWERLLNYRTYPVSDLYVMDSCSQSRIHFEQLNSKTPIAHIVENEAIICALYDRLKEFSADGKVEVEAECRVDACSLPDNLSQNAKVTLANGKVIETSLLIGADGAKSSVRAAMGINYTQWEYAQNAIVCTLNVSSMERPTIAWQRFTPLGPIALLPLGEGNSSLVWTTSAEDAKRLIGLSESEFIEQLNYYLATDSQQSSLANKALFAMDKAWNCLPSFSAHSRSTVGLLPPVVVGIQRGSQRAAFPLAFGHSNDYVTTRAALIGDAAHRVHPLAGQGVNLGWFDVESLTACLEKSVAEGADIGSTTYLADYDTQSQRHNVPVMLAIDGLKRLYSTDFGPLVFLRSIGLHAIDKLLPLKDLIIYKASR